MEAKTGQQSGDVLWFAEQRKRITASIAKTFARHCEDPPPEKLVMQIVERCSFFLLLRLTVCKKKRLPEQFILLSCVPLQALVHKQALQMRPVGLCISTEHPWLAGSPHGAVIDTTEAEEGQLEVKCSIV